MGLLSDFWDIFQNLFYYIRYGLSSSEMVFLQIVVLQNIAPRIVSEAGGVSGVKNRKLSLADPTPVNLCSLGSATPAYINRSYSLPNVGI